MPCTGGIDPTGKSNFTGGGVQQRIVPQSVMIVEILIAATQIKPPLGNQVTQGVCDALRVEGIAQHMRHG
jgi:hypothetical protein